MKDNTDLLGDIDQFIEKTITTLNKDGVDVSNYELDHICYRVDSIERYKEYQNELSQLGTLLSETEINGRQISTYKLAEPICFQERKINLVELPSPKEGSPYPEGLEHAEFVIPDEFEIFMKKYPNIKFDLRDIDKKINPDIKIKYAGFSVKFHHKPLEYIIKYEQ